MLTTAAAAAAAAAVMVYVVANFNMSIIVVTRLEYSDVTCHVVLLYSVDWTKAGISFLVPTVNLFRN